MFSSSSLLPPGNVLPSVINIAIAAVLPKGFAVTVKPKAGGVGYVLTAMGEQLHRVLDVTIVYPGGSKTFWEFLSGEVAEVRVQVRVLPITPELLGNYEEDSAYRARLQKWLNELWVEKDARLNG